MATFSECFSPFSSSISKEEPSIPTLSAIPFAKTFSSGKANNLYLNEELPELIAKTFFINVIPP